MSTFWKGMALPWGTSPSSVFGGKPDIDVLKTSVEMIVLTATGERCMRPTFGTSISELLFNPADITTVNKCRESVRRAIVEWDNRVTFVDFTVQKQQNTLTFRLQYKLAGDKNPDGIQILDIPVSADMLK
jgi:phage baseplate assembly protein W